MRTHGPPVFPAISDPTRRDLLLRLAGKERSAAELAAPFPTTRSAISQHLAILLDAELVERRREGRFQLYRLRVEPLEEVSDWVQLFENFWDERLDRLGRRLEEAG